MFHVVPDYPSNAARGGDFLTGATKGDIAYLDEDGVDQLRAEKVVVTDRNIDFEGPLCFGERTARQLAHAFGMVDGWRVDALKRDHEVIRTERDDLSRQVMRLRGTIETMKQLDGPEQGETVYVALDGTDHATRAAAISHSQHAARLFPPVVARARPIVGDEAPPVPVAEETPV